jgi:hypothetical protein
MDSKEDVDEIALTLANISISEEDAFVKKAVDFLKAKKYFVSKQNFETIRRFFTNIHSTLASV